MRLAQQLVALALLLVVCRAQWATFSATHFAVLSGQAVVPAPITTLNVGYVLLNAANIASTGSVTYAIVTNATGVTNVAAYFWTSDSEVGPLLVGNISLPTQGYANAPTFYTGTFTVAALSISLPSNLALVAATQIYFEVHTTTANGAELRGRVQNINGKYTHTAVLTTSQTVPALTGPDGGIAIARAQVPNFVWASAWSPKDTITNGINLNGPAAVGATAPRLFSWTSDNSTTATSGTLTSLSNDPTVPFSLPNFNNNQIYVLVQTVTYPNANQGAIRGQFVPITVVSDAAFTNPPTTKPSGAVGHIASLALIAAAALVLMA